MYQSNELKAAINAALTAASVMNRYISHRSPVNLKHDLSLLTDADVEAEKAIMSILRDTFPTYRILGEELGETLGDSEYIWVVDPIDGTKHFVRGIPLFATQIALICGEIPILGVSNAPLMNELVYAEIGQGAFLNGSPIRVSGVSAMEEAYLSFGNIKHFNRCGVLQGLLEVVNVSRNARGIGDAWSYHLLAQGKIDVMVEARTKIWDIAAATVFVTEAGGRVTDLRGAPIGMGSTSIVATNGNIHAEVLRLINTATK